MEDFEKNNLKQAFAIGASLLALAYTAIYSDLERPDPPRVQICDKVSSPNFQPWQ